VSVYMKDTFWMRMNTMQLSESMNAFYFIFYGYLHSQTTLKEFVD
jgi:hypothetical protein